MVRHILTNGKDLKREQIIELAREKGILRTRDLEAHGIAGEYLNKLLAEGTFERPGRGLYRLVTPEQVAMPNLRKSPSGFRNPWSVSSRRSTIMA